MNTPTDKDAPHAAPMNPPPSGSEGDSQRSPQGAGQPMSAARRRWLFASVAGAAAVAGITLAWRNGHVVSTASAPVDGLWELEFPTPHGAKLTMGRFRGQPLLLNFWATWCPPCVEEMPLLDRFFAENNSNGWQVLGLAVDQAAPVNRFLLAQPVRFPIALAGLAGADLSRKLGNAQGGLPFSVAFDGSGRIVQRKMGQLTEQDLQQWQALR